MGSSLRKYYEQIRIKDVDADLAAVWVIEPQEVIDQSFSSRRQQEELSRCGGGHLKPYTQHKIGAEIKHQFFYALFLVF